MRVYKRHTFRLCYMITEEIGKKSLQLQARIKRPVVHILKQQHLYISASVKSRHSFLRIFYSIKQSNSYLDLFNDASSNEYII
jgi:hypothetical protein